MTEFYNVIETILVLGVAMLVGFVCVKSGYISNEVRESLSKIIVKVTFPVLVVTTMTKIELDSTKIVNSVTILIISFIVLGFLLLCGLATAKLFKMEDNRAKLHMCMNCFGNVVFVAYPLIQAIYGDEGVFYAALFSFANDCYLWTVGIYNISSKKGSGGFGQNIKKLINPGTIAVVTALAMLALNLRFGGILKQSLEGIGGITSYLSMLFLGGTLALVDFRNIYKRISLYIILLLKMILVPILLAVILKYIGIDDTVLGVAVLQTAMPVSTVLTILAEEYKCDSIYCAEGSFITTVACVATLPAVYWFITQVI